MSSSFARAKTSRERYSRACSAPSESARWGRRSPPASRPSKPAAAQVRRRFSRRARGVHHCPLVYLGSAWRQRGSSARKANKMTETDELFLITGATGNTGAHTVKLLRERGRRVRALVHSLDERANRPRELGAEVVQGDLLDFPAVSAATAGVSAAYFNYPVAPGLVEATANFVQAASEAGVHAVVNMSQIPARREATSNAARAHWIAERLLDRSALITTHLRPTFFTFLLNMFWIRHNHEGI